MKKQNGQLKKNIYIYICFINYAKALDCVEHKKLLKLLKEMGILDHFTCLIGNLYSRQELIVGIRHGTINWFKIGKRGVLRLYIVTLFI